MSACPVRVASGGMGWWADVLADAIQRTTRLKIVSWYTRSAEKREAFARKDGCKGTRTEGEVLPRESD